jgi:4-hydroxybenzoate polyprenyltransferase
MNWHTLGSWGFGFFCIPVGICVLGIAIGALILWGGLFEQHALDPANAWCGAFLFVALAIISIIVAANVFK